MTPSWAFGTDVMCYFFVSQDWEWRYGSTPNFSHYLKTRFDWGLVEMHLDVAHGKINKAVLFSDSLFPDFIEEAMNELTGKTSVAVSAATSALATHTCTPFVPLARYPL